MTTYRRLALSAALGAVLAAAVTHAPVARADAGSFLDEMDSYGFFHTDGPGGLLQLGFAVCSMLSTPGVDGNDAARAIYRNTGLSIDANDSLNIVIISVENLCPEYDHRGESIA